MEWILYIMFKAQRYKYIEQRRLNRRKIFVAGFTGFKCVEFRVIYVYSIINIAITSQYTVLINGLGRDKPYHLVIISKPSLSARSCQITFSNHNTNTLL